MFQTMRFTEPGMSESHLAAHFEYICARDGAQRLAYVPVVASGYVHTPMRSPPYNCEALNSFCLWV